MFGDEVRDEITANLLNSTSYPRALSIALCVLIAIIPLTKLPLNARPLVCMIESFTGSNAHDISDAPPLTGLSNWSRGILRIFVRAAVIVIFVMIAIVFPA